MYYVPSSVLILVLHCSLYSLIPIHFFPSQAVYIPSGFQGILAFNPCFWSWVGVVDADNGY